MIIEWKCEPLFYKIGVYWLSNEKCEGAITVWEIWTIFLYLS